MGTCAPRGVTHVLEPGASSPRGGRRGGRNHGGPASLSLNPFTWETQAPSGRMGTAGLVALLQLWVSYGVSRCIVGVQGHLSRPQHYCPGARARAMGFMLHWDVGVLASWCLCLVSTPLGQPPSFLPPPSPSRAQASCMVKKTGVVCSPSPSRASLWSAELCWSLRG